MSHFFGIQFPFWLVHPLHVLHPFRGVLEKEYKPPDQVCQAHTFFVVA